MNITITQQDLQNIISNTRDYPLLHNKFTTYDSVGLSRPCTLTKSDNPLVFEICTKWDKYANRHILSAYTVNTPVPNELWDESIVENMVEWAINQ